MAISEESPLLNLPLELRDQIYEYVALGSSVIIKHQQLITDSSLLLVSRKIKEEFENILYTSAPILKAYVEEFDFTHVIAFLEQLSAIADKDPNRLNIPKERTYRQLDIVFILSPACLKSLGKLREWLELISSLNDDHYMTAFATSYTIQEPTIAPITIMRIVDEVYQVWFERAKPGPLKREIGKVADVLAAAETRENKSRAGGLGGGPVGFSRG